MENITFEQATASKTAYNTLNLFAVGEAVCLNGDYDRKRRKFHKAVCVGEASRVRGDDDGLWSLRTVNTFPVGEASRARGDDDEKGKYHTWCTFPYYGYFAFF